MGENLPTQVTENLDLIESASADFVCVVVVLTAEPFSNTLLGLFEGLRPIKIFLKAFACGYRYRDRCEKHRDREPGSLPSIDV